MKIFKYLGIGFGVLVSIGITVLIVLGSIAPETSIYLGRQLPKKYVLEIKSLGLVGENEEIKYFYSDAYFDIKDGMYFVTDKNLILYSSDWEDPKTIIKHSDILNIKVDYNDSFFEDSLAVIDTTEYELSFPLSSEHGIDKKFIEFLSSKIQTARADDATK